MPLVAKKALGSTYRPAYQLVPLVGQKALASESYIETCLPTVPLVALLIYIRCTIKLIATNFGTTRPFQVHFSFCYLWHILVSGRSGTFYFLPLVAHLSFLAQPNRF